ncbi:MAG: hypothetical protein ACOYMF_05715 [Bacteroidales bacterium]
MSYNRRYYLHRRVRKAGITLNTRGKLISLTPDRASSAKNMLYIYELAQKYNYGVQFTNPILDL